MKKQSDEARLCTHTRGRKEDDAENDAIPRTGERPIYM
jgi:hypothetical protein